MAAYVTLKPVHLDILEGKNFSLGIHMDVTLAHNAQLNTVTRSYQQGNGTRSPFKFSRSQFD